MPNIAPTEVAGHNFEFWLEKLSPTVNRDAAVRELAILMLPQFGEQKLQKAMPHIIERLRDGDPAVKFNALMLICHVNIEKEEDRKRAINLIFNPETGLVMSSNEMLRLAAVNAAAHIGPLAAPAIPCLIGQAHLQNANSYEARRSAAAALGQIARGQQSVSTSPSGPDKRVISVLVERLGADPCLAVRIEIAKSLMLLGKPADEKDVVAERNMLMARINQDPRNGGEPDKVLRMWLRVALIRLADKEPSEKELDPIVEMLRASDQYERVSAAQAMGVLGKGVASSKAGALRVAFDFKNSPKSEDMDFLYMCLWSIGRMGTDAQMMQKEVQELSTTHPDGAVKEQAKETLLKIQGKLIP
jgi:HEAT repeat protein